MIKYEEIQLKGEAGRLDKVLSQLLPDYSRTQIQTLINDEMVTVNGKIEKAKFKLQGDEFIKAEIPAEEELDIEGEEMDLDILYEDEDILIINKPRGMVVHPSKGHPNGTLVNGLVAYLGDKLSSQGDAYRRGLVHRIDKDTSGLIAIAKTNDAYHRLSEQLQDKTMGRAYLALVNGVLESDQGVIEVPIARDPRQRTRFAPDHDGKYALTEFEVIERYPQASLVEARLQTGRTHQIRVHLEFIGHPIVGDPTYRQGLADVHGTVAKLSEGQYLHAYKLSFIHPTNGEYMEVKTEIPEYFNDLIRTFG